MPNGGSDNCGTCIHFDSERARCALRQASIRLPHWTKCRNFARFASAQDTSADPDGPLYAIVGIVKDGGGAYFRVPYLDGNRVHTERPDSGDTILSVTDGQGQTHKFESVEDYMHFREKRRNDREKRGDD